MGADGTLETAGRTIWMVLATPCLRLNQEKKQAKVQLKLANPSALSSDHDDDDEVVFSE